MALFTKKRQPRPSGYDRSGQLIVDFWPEHPQKAKHKPDEEPKIYSLPCYTGPTCPECGAPAVNGFGCRELYEELLRLETCDPDGAGSVHRLSVLCYVVQHPQDYSDAALNWGIASLRELVHNQPSVPAERPELRGPLRFFRQRSKTDEVREQGSDSRPNLPAQWQMTIDQVYYPDPHGHPERVQQWARTILGDLGQ